MASRFTSVLVLLVLFSTVAFAQQIYKWKDKKGQWHFSDHPPAEVRAEKVKGLDIGPVPPVPPQDADPPILHAGSKSTEQAVSKPRLTEEVSREQREYQKRLDEIVQQIKALKERIEFTSRGFKVKEKLAPGEVWVYEGGKSLRYSRYPKEPIRPGVIPPTSPARSIESRVRSREQEVDRLGIKLKKLYKKRDELVREMKQKGFKIGYIPY